MGTPQELPTDGEPWTLAVPEGMPSFPPPNFFHFAGFDYPRNARGIYLNSTSVFWFQGAFRLMRTPKSLGGAPGLVFATEAPCQDHLATIDSTYFYCLSTTSVWRAHLDDRTETRIPLDWDHSGGGAGFLVDASYVYAAMPGCAALTRIDKQTLEREVMYIEGVGFPGRGHTVLAKAGERLVCGSPREFYLIDNWGEPPRKVYDQVRELFGLAAIDDQIFWLEQPSSENTSLGRVSLDGDGAALVATDTTGHHSRLLYAAGAEKLIWGGQTALRTFDLAGAVFSGGARLGVIRDIALDDDHVYATISGFLPKTVDGRPVNTEAYWIARVSLQDLE